MNRETVNSVAQLVDNLVKNIRNSDSDNLVVFLDTGAIIDFEREIKRLRSVEKGATISQFYQNLLDCKFPFFVTNHILEEVCSHTHHFLNGQAEVSNDSFDFAKQMHSQYCSFLMGICGNALEIDDIRYSVFWAGEGAFAEDHKKNCRDHISLADRDLIASALWTRYTSVRRGLSGEIQPISASIVITPDCHYSKTCEVLTAKTPFEVVRNGDLFQLSFGYNGLRVISSRLLGSSY